MTEEEFTALSLSDKWSHVKETMGYIAHMDSMYNLRRRLNPHHPIDQVQHENRSMRLDQYQRWSHIKNLYASHRDEMTNTLDNEEYNKCKNILERIFTMEVDDALRNIIGE